MRRNGFSLLELIVVLILISLSAALVIPSLSRFSSTIELKAAAKKVSGILRYGRSEAVNKGQIYQVLLDSESRQVSLQSVGEDDPEEKKEGKQYKKTYSLPEGIQIVESDIPPPQCASDLPTIEFYPNGGSNGGIFFLNSADQRGYKIMVDFLTGIVKIERREG